MKLVEVTVMVEVKDDVDADDVREVVEDSLIHTDEYNDQAMQGWYGYSVSFEVK